jgi:hypothetical protein
MNRRCELAGGAQPPQLKAGAAGLNEPASALNIDSHARAREPDQPRQRSTPPPATIGSAAAVAWSQFAIYQRPCLLCLPTMARMSSNEQPLPTRRVGDASRRQAATGAGAACPAGQGGEAAAAGLASYP